MADTIATNLLSYLGLIGSAGAHTGSLVPRANTPQASSDLWRDFQDAGKIADPDIWTKFNQAMKRPVTFDAMLQLWEEMATWDLMAAALVEIVDEATQVDANSPATVWYTCNDHSVEDDLNSLLVKLDVETVAPSQIWHIAALGNHFEKLDYAPEEGVIGMSFVHPMDVRRYWLERNKKCIGFRWSGHKPSKEAAFVMPDNQTPIPRVTLSDGGKSTEELWYPWDFMHMRRMFRLRISEHGEPIFDEAEGIYKKLKMAIDQMVVHRAQVQPDRYVINIDVKDQPPAEQMKTIQRWKQALRSKLAFGQNQSGAANALQAPSDFQSFYNAWSLDTILWVAKPREFQHSVEKLQGTQNIPDVYDIELLTDLFYSIIGMPRSWFSAKTGGGGEGSDGNAPSGKALLAQDMRFLRKIKSIRRPMINCYTWLAYFHCVLKGKDIRQLDIKANMPPIGSLEDQMKLEMLKQQAEVLDILADVMDKYSLPKEAWIEIVFKKYLHLPDEIVNIFITALPGEMEPVPVESLQQRSKAPYSYRLIRQIEEAVKDNPVLGAKLQELKHCVYADDPRAISEAKLAKAKRDVMAETMFKMPSLQDLDLIVSSYGRSPFELKRAQEGTPSGKFMIQPKALMEDTTAEAPRAPTDYSVQERPQPIKEAAWRRFFPKK